MADPPHGDTPYLNSRSEARLPSSTPNQPSLQIKALNRDISDQLQHKAFRSDNPRETDTPHFAASPYEDAEHALLPLNVLRSPLQSSALITGRLR